MSINTKKVSGRRPVRYESFDALLADARRLAQSDARALGNWSPGQIYEHLARSLNSSIDGMGFALPAPVRWIMSTFMKRRFLKQAIPAGFRTTGQFAPEEISTAAGLESLERAIARQKQEPQRAAHPAFGKITRSEWDDFHLRHAELHMSFLTDGRDGAA